MNTQKIKVGTVLTAINKCHMSGSTWVSDDDKGTLTIGKDYEVIVVAEHRASIKVIDDNSNKHYFTLDILSNYFTVKQY